MKKKDVIKFFGSPLRVADALGLTSTASVHAWPEPLSENLQQRVIGAALRTTSERELRRRFPKYFEAR